MCSSCEGEEGGAGRFDRGASRLSRRLISSMSWRVGARWSSRARPASKGASLAGEETDCPGLDCTSRPSSSSRLRHRPKQIEDKTSNTHKKTLFLGYWVTAEVWSMFSRRTSQPGIKKRQERVYEYVFPYIFLKLTKEFFGQKYFISSFLDQLAQVFFCTCSKN
jgi:hypothetical protein